MKPEGKAPTLLAPRPQRAAAPWGQRGAAQEQCQLDPEAPRSHRAARAAAGLALNGLLHTVCCFSTRRVPTRKVGGRAVPAGVARGAAVPGSSGSCTKSQLLYPK